MLQLVPSRRGYLSLIPELDLFDRFFDDLPLPSLFSEGKVLSPAFDISETEKEYVITGEIPKGKRNRKRKKRMKTTIRLRDIMVRSSGASGFPRRSKQMNWKLLTKMVS
jgi:hypothetical protein